MNCKQGDLAIVIKSTLGKSVGQIVVILYWVGHVSNSWGDFNDCWEVAAPPGGQLMSMLGPVESTFVPDSWLRPVSGLPMEEDVRDEIKEPA